MIRASDLNFALILISLKWTVSDGIWIQPQARGSGVCAHDHCDDRSRHSNDDHREMHTQGRLHLQKKKVILGINLTRKAQGTQR